MQSNRIFVHAGWNKTATTFLQRDIFVPIFGEGLIGPNKKFNDLQRQDSQANDALLFSDESLLGVTFFKHHGSRNLQRYHFLDNWAKLAPNSQFIVCVRKHSDFLESLYRQYLQVGGDQKPEQFIDTQHDEGFIQADELLYAPILEKLTQRFAGPHFIYDFDAFKADQDYFLTELLRFLGQDVQSLQGLLEKAQSRRQRNISITYNSGIYLRLINKVVSSKLHPDKPIPLPVFQFFTLGKTPRRLFQRGAKEKVKRKFTEGIYTELHEKFGHDWDTVQANFITVAKDTEIIGNASISSTENSLVR